MTDNPTPAMVVGRPPCAGLSDDVINWQAYAAYLEDLVRREAHALERDARFVRLYNFLDMSVALQLRATLLVEALDPELLGPDDEDESESDTTHESEDKDDEPSTNPPPGAA